MITAELIGIWCILINCILILAKLYDIEKMQKK